MLVRTDFPICNVFGLKMQVIISYLGCVCKRKAPDGKGSASAPGGFMTELANMACLSQSDLVFKWGWGVGDGNKRKENRWIKGQLLQGTKKGQSSCSIG